MRRRFMFSRPPFLTSTLFVLSNPADGSALDKEKEELQKAHTRAEVERMQAQSQLALRNQEYEKQAATLRSLQERLEEAELNASLGGSGTRPDLTRPRRQCPPMRLILSRALTLRQAAPTSATARSSLSCTLAAAAFPSTWRRGLTPCPPPRLSAYFCPTDRRTKNAQLEQENRMLRAAGGADGAASGQAAVLDAILRDTQAAKDKLEAVRGPPGDPSTVFGPSGWGLNARSMRALSRRCTGLQDGAGREPGPAGACHDAGDGDGRRAHESEVGTRARVHSRDRVG